MRSYFRQSVPFHPTKDELTQLLHFEMCFGGRTKFFVSISFRPYSARNCFDYLVGLQKKVRKRHCSTLFYDRVSGTTPDSSSRGRNACYRQILVRPRQPSSGSFSFYLILSSATTRRFARSERRPGTYVK